MNSPKKPNKKRNSLLVFEFLTLMTASCMLSEDEKKAVQISNLLKKYFKKGTELYKEYKLAKSMVESKVSSEAIAANVLQQARSAAMSINSRKIEEEKTRLIEDMQKVDPTGFIFEQHVPNYRIYSTVGTLIRDWYSGGLVDLKRIATFESAVAAHLVNPILESREDSDVEKDISALTPGERRFAFASFAQKIEERWGKTLSRRQKVLLQEAMLDDKARLQAALRDSRDHVLAYIDRISKKVGMPFEKLQEVRSIIEEDNDFLNVDDSTISRYMHYLDIEKEYPS